MAKTVKTSPSNQAEPSQVLNIPISAITLDPNQPRKELDTSDESSPASMAALEASINAQGLIQPIIVIKRGRKYEIIAGERRYTACKNLNWKTIPCIVREEDYNNLSRPLKQLAENIFRKDLTVEEEAMFLRRCLESHPISQRELADFLGHSESWVSRRLAILEVDPLTKEAIRAGFLTGTNEIELFRRLPSPKQESLITQGREAQERTPHKQHKIVRREIENLLIQNQGVDLSLPSNNFEPAKSVSKGSTPGAPLESKAPKSKLSEPNIPPISRGFEMSYMRFTPDVRLTIPEIKQALMNLGEDASGEDGLMLNSRLSQALLRISRVDN